MKFLISFAETDQGSIKDEQTKKKNYTGSKKGSKKNLRLDLSESNKVTDKVKSWVIALPLNFIFK